MRFLTNQKQLKVALLALVIIVGLGVAVPASAYAATPANWSAHPAAPDSLGWQDIAWSPQLKLFAAVGTNSAMTSPDGITWTAQTVVGPAAPWRTVTWSPDLGIFVALSGSSTSTALISSDGITWTQQAYTLAGGPRTWNSVTWSHEQHQFVAVGLTLGSAMTSPDGITWTRTTSTVIGTTTGIAWSPNDNLYVVSTTAASPGVVDTSPDGITWTAQTVPIGNSRGITYASDKDLFVLAGINGIATSPDGITWIARTTPIANFQDVTYSAENGEFVAVGTDGIATSPDGITWTQVTSPASNGWKAIVWAAGLYRYAAVANSGGANRTMVGLVPTTPSAPLSLTVSLNGKNVNLSWNTPSFDGNSTITGYRIERSSNGGQFEQLVANTASIATTYTDTTAAAGQTYAYRIYALNTQGQSAVSDAVSIQVSATGTMLVDTGINQQTVILFVASLLIIGAILLRLA